MATRSDNEAAVGDNEVLSDEDRNDESPEENSSVLKDDDSKCTIEHHYTGGTNADQKTIVNEILRCLVCLELPKGNKKVPVCGQGHHFCINCQKKMNLCAICRDKFYNGRNFAVEELISKAGTFLGVPKNYLPQAATASHYPKGIFECLHGCKKRMSGSNFISHLRQDHTSEFFEDLKVNPYNNKFEHIFDLDFKINTSYTKTFQVNEIGLFTININILDNSLVAYMQMLADNKYLSGFRYCLNIGSFFEKMPVNDYTRSNCRFLNYLPVQNLNNLKDIDTLKVKEYTFSLFNVPNRETQITICVWKQEQKALVTDDVESLTILPNPVTTHSEIRKRKNRARNIRRKKLKAAHNVVNEDVVI